MSPRAEAPAKWGGSSVLPSTICSMGDTFPARSVATEIRRRLPGVPLKKLHKLLYYCQAHHLATFGTPLFVETISAWDMGPVVGQLWYLENQHGPSTSTEASLTEAELNTIGYVVSRYGHLSGLELERLTHSETPWIKADEARRELGVRAYKITIEELRSYFVEQATLDETEDAPLDRAEIETWLRDVQGHDRDQLTVDTPEALLGRRR